MMSTAYANLLACMLGYISVRSLQGCMEDIGVPLSGTDVFAIRNLFGRAEVPAYAVK
jgi:hypothetical protein